MKKLLWLLPIIPLICLSFAPPSDAQTKPKRINRAIEMLEQDQTIYYFTEGRGGSQGGYKEGLALAKTWAEMIIYEMEFGGVRRHRTPRVHGRARRRRTDPNGSPHPSRPSRASFRRL